MTDPADIVERLNDVREEGVHMLDVLAHSNAKLGACSEIAGWISDARIQLASAASLIEAQQAEIDRLRRIAQARKEHGREQRAEIMELREALEFYAEPKNYNGGFVPGGPTEHGTYALSHHVNLVRRDRGKRARAALGGQSNG